MNATNDFGKPEYSSGIIESNSTSYTTDKPIPDGIWYWRVRTRDIEGGWGPYCPCVRIAIDSTPPRGFTPVISPNTWTKGNCTITFSSDDNTSGIDHYELLIDNILYGGVESPFELPVLPDGIHRIIVRAYDIAGNFMDGNALLYQDNGRPEPFSPTVFPGAWSNISLQVSFFTVDAVSGIDHYEVALDGTAFFTQSNPYILPGLTEGEHNITVRAFDRAGNYQDGTVMVGIDRTPPLNLLISSSPSGWTNTDIKLIFSAVDPVSGISRYEVRINNDSYKCQTSPMTLKELRDGLNQITVRAYDSAGNFVEGRLETKIDKTPPRSFTPSAAPAGWTRFPSVISFSTTDYTSGIDHYELRVDDWNWTTVTSPFNLFDIPDGQHNVTVRAFDIAGNFVDGTVNVFIDTTPPVQTKSLINGGAKSTDSRSVTLTISAIDNASGVDEMCFSNDGKTYSDWKPYETNSSWELSSGTGDKTVYVKTKDAAGNEAQPVSSTMKLPAASCGVSDG
jgi:hypothetical protein